VIGLLSTASGRFYLKHPWQLCLAVTGIALGVAVYVGVDLANDSARRAFELSENLVLGRVTHQLVGLDGSLPNSVYRDLRVEHGQRPGTGRPGNGTWAFERRGSRVDRWS
jgi:putative ABC transport system permease protein